MALLLQMTAEDNSTPTRKKNCEEKSPNLTPRSINRRNERGETPLHVAAIRGDLRKVRELILKGADVNTSDYAGILTTCYLFIPIYILAHTNYLCFRLDTTA